MNQHIAFIRAINVAGHAIVRMTDLCGAFTAAGCENVRTYIQSGNVVFESPAGNPEPLFRKIRIALRGMVGQNHEIAFRTVREIEALVRKDPFKSFTHDRGLKLYVAFLSQKPRIKPKFPLISVPEALEAFAMKDLHVFIVSRRKKNGMYGFPNNFIEKELGVSATTRNWTTVTKILKFVAQGSLAYKLRREP